MNFNRHSDLEGLHAFLGASKYHWINYTEEKIVSSFLKFQAIEKGTELHALARDLIRQNVKLPKSDKSLNAYVNDAIGYKMTPELVLFYSGNAFGTADAICFKEKEKKLRIHDLKTGASPTSIHQLEIYAAYFCLEYEKDPAEISIELRIYQNDTILVAFPEAEIIRIIMNKIVLFDRILNNIESEEAA
jgi:hypothetical protein